jgi:ribosomal protein S18 acetylase RimI-like enzyme
MRLPGLTLRDEVLPADRQSVRCILESTGFFYSYEIEVAVELVDERLSKGLKSGYLFLFAEHDGQVVGYTCYGPIACTKCSYDLFWIGVMQARQGQGIGQFLLDESEHRIQALGGRQVYIETSGRSQYDPTRGFYFRCGYSEEARLRDFYGPGDDKVVFLKPLYQPHPAS